MIRGLFEFWPQRFLIRLAFWGSLVSPVLTIGWTLFAIYAYDLTEDVEYIRDAERTNSVILSISFCVAALIYGINRVYAFHPVFNPNYLQWLTSTPYTGRQALPLGPVHLVAKDLSFAVAALAASVVSGMGSWHIPLVCLLIGYAIALAAAALRTGDVLLSTCLSFMLPAALLLLPSSIGRVFLIILLALATRWAAKRNLRDFPWSAEGSHGVVSDMALPKGGMTLTSASAAQTLTMDEKDVGWPLADLGPQKQWAHISGWLASLISLWIGAVVVCGGFCAERLFAESLIISAREMKTLSAFCLLAAVVASIVRTTIYIPRARPPLTLLGRIASGRIIIPSYHKVYIPCILAVITAVALPRFLFFLTSSGTWLIGITLSTCCLILLGMGPDLKTWTLTGSYRLQRSTFLNDNDVRIRQCQTKP